MKQVNLYCKIIWNDFEALLCKWLVVCSLPSFNVWVLPFSAVCLSSGSLRQPDGVICRYLHSTYLSDMPERIETCTETFETSLKGSG